MERRLISSTQSVCPVCLKKIEARRVQYGDEVYLEKCCSVHGDFKTLIWKGKLEYELWENRESAVSYPQEEENCPYVCGDCQSHHQHACCVLLEVTGRCSLHCPICFADANSQNGTDMSLKKIDECFDEMMRMGGPFNIQLSGGEPTMRNDLDVIIKSGKEKGFHFFQLNTNGIRLAEEEGYARHLKEAGLDCVFLQFDALDNEAYMKIRGKALLETKKKAIQVCAEAGLGVVLVPTLIAGVNTDQVGKIIQYAFSRMPAVRGVHFQPISYFGRFPDEEQKRYTIPQLLQAIEDQTAGQIRISDFAPGGAENAYCSFSGNFVLDHDNIKPWKRDEVCGCGVKVEKTKEKSIQARKFVAKRWAAPKAVKLQQTQHCCEVETSSLDRFLEQLETHTLAVSCMAFMDGGNFDIERLKDCYIHIVTNQDKVRLIPFCAYNLSSTEGETLYRGKYQS